MPSNQALRTSEANKELLAAFDLALSAMEVPARSGFNKHGEYHYSSLDDYLNVSMPKLGEQNLRLVNSVTKIENLETGTSKHGAAVYRVRVWVSTTLLHSKSGQWLEIDSVADAADAGDKCVGKAITAARKAALAQLLSFGGMTVDSEHPSNEDRGESKSQNWTQRGGRASKPAAAEKAPAPAKVGKKPEHGRVGESEAARSQAFDDLRALLPELTIKTKKTSQQLMEGWCVAQGVTDLTEMSLEQLGRIIAASRAKLGVKKS